VPATSPDGQLLFTNGGTATAGILTFPVEWDFSVNREVNAKQAPERNHCSSADNRTGRMTIEFATAPRNAHRKSAAVTVTWPDATTMIVPSNYNNKCDDLFADAPSGDWFTTTVPVTDLQNRRVVELTARKTLSIPLKDPAYIGYHGTYHFAWTAAIELERIAGPG